MQFGAKYWLEAIGKVLVNFGVNEVKYGSVEHCRGARVFWVCGNFGMGFCGVQLSHTTFYKKGRSHLARAPRSGLTQLNV